MRRFPKAVVLDCGLVVGGGLGALDDDRHSPRRHKLRRRSTA
jgi:hypothetical protein